MDSIEKSMGMLTLEGNSAETETRGEWFAEMDSIKKLMQMMKLEGHSTETDTRAMFVQRLANSLRQVDSMFEPNKDVKNYGRVKKLLDEILDCYNFSPYGNPVISSRFAHDDEMSLICIEEVQYRSLNHNFPIAVTIAVCRGRYDIFLTAGNTIWLFPHFDDAHIQNFIEPVPPMKSLIDQYLVKLIFHFMETLERITKKKINRFQLRSK